MRSCWSPSAEEQCGPRSRTACSAAERCLRPLHPLVQALTTLVTSFIKLGDRILVRSEREILLVRTRAHHVVRHSLSPVEANHRSFDHHADLFVERTDAADAQPRGYRIQSNDDGKHHRQLQLIVNRIALPLALVCSRSCHRPNFNRNLELYDPPARRPEEALLPGLLVPVTRFPEVHVVRVPPAWTEIEGEAFYAGLQFGNRIAIPAR